MAGRLPAGLCSRSAKLCAVRRSRAHGYDRTRCTLHRQRTRSKTHANLKLQYRRRIRTLVAADILIPTAAGLLRLKPTIWTIPRVIALTCRFRREHTGWTHRCKRIPASGALMTRVFYFRGCACRRRRHSARGWYERCLAADPVCQRNPAQRSTLSGAKCRHGSIRGSAWMATKERVETGYPPDGPALCLGCCYRTGRTCRWPQSPAPRFAALRLRRGGSRADYVGIGGRQQ